MLACARTFLKIDVSSFVCLTYNYILHFGTIMNDLDLHSMSHMYEKPIAVGIPFK